MGFFDWSVLILLLVLKKLTGFWIEGLAFILPIILFAKGTGRIEGLPSFVAEVIALFLGSYGAVLTKLLPDCSGRTLRIWESQEISPVNFCLQLQDSLA